MSLQRSVTTILCLSLMLSIAVSAAEDLRVLPEKIGDVAPSEMMKHYLRRIAQQKFEDWKIKYEQRKTPEQIAEYQKHLRREFIKAIGGLRMMLLWPPLYRWAVIDKAPETPGEEFGILKTWLDHAVEEGYEYFSPVTHPWSNYRFDDRCGAVGLMLRHAKERGLEVMTYSALYERYAERAGKR